MVNRRKGLLFTCVVVMAWFAGGCGPDAELVANGVIHQCELKRIEAELANDPANAALLAEQLDRAALFASVIETAPEGQRAALTEAIAARVADGACP